jgi:hypothetical protein
LARTLAPTTTLSEQAALNHIAFGVAAARSTDLFVEDAQGTTLALSVTNASKAVPVGTRAIVFWADVDFFYRFNTTATTAEGAKALANDVTTVSVDPDDAEILVSSLQAILASGTGTLYVNWFSGS